MEGRRLVKGRGHWKVERLEKDRGQWEARGYSEVKGWQRSLGGWMENVRGQWE